MKTRLHDSWNAGRPGINSWISSAAPVVAEFTGKAGFDSITIDMQHGLNDYQVAVSMLQALSMSDATPMVRVPWLEPGIVMKSLDAGALGIICPMVNTRSDAEHLVSWAKYAPAGSRSFGPTRAQFVYGADYPTKANDSIILLAMAETAQALENIESIVSTPGLTGIYIGPSDLALSMGYAPKLDQEEPAVVEAIGHILASCRKAKVRCGIHCLETAYARKMLDQDFDLVTLGSDLRLYAAACADAVSKTRGEG